LNFSMGKWVANPRLKKSSSLFATSIYRSIIVVIILGPVIAMIILKVVIYKTKYHDATIDWYYDLNYAILILYAIILYLFAVPTIQWFFGHAPFLRNLMQIIGHSGYLDKIYLSDGGHFENLATYELFRRKCKTIFTFDASQDYERKMPDLLQLLTIAQMDGLISYFEILPGSTVEDMLMQKQLALNMSNSRFLKIKVRYGVKPDSDEIPLEGTVWYVKCSVIEKDPAKLHLFTSLKDPFPHTPTYDQLFDSTMFEYYRTLGRNSAQDLSDAVLKAIEEDV